MTAKKNAAGGANPPTASSTSTASLPTIQAQSASRTPRPTAGPTSSSHGPFDVGHPSPRRSVGLMDSAESEAMRLGAEGHHWRYVLAVLGPTTLSTGLPRWYLARLLKRAVETGAIRAGLRAA